MTGTFSERIAELADNVGHGTLTGKVVVDQVYSHVQHEALDYRHPRGGQAKFLETPTISGASEHMARIAKTVLEPGGPVDGMREAVDNIGDQVAILAPVEFDDLRRSAHPSVEDDGVVVYDKPPQQPRLTEQELEAKSELRELGYGPNIRRGRGHGPNSRWG